MDVGDFAFYKLNTETIIKPFDCGDKDLNSFLQEEAVLFSHQLLATTFILEREDDIVAFFSIFNDSIRVEEIFEDNKSAVKRFLRNFLPHPKRYIKNLPAIKIGRLAVSNNIQKGGIGKMIIDFIIDFAIRQNDTCACKFIAVDAYRKSIGFYQKMGFTFFTPADENEDTRQMYLDLTPLINTAKESIETNVSIETSPLSSNNTPKHK